MKLKTNSTLLSALEIDIPALKEDQEGQLKGGFVSIGVSEAGAFAFQDSCDNGCQNSCVNDCKVGSCQYNCKETCQKECKSGCTIETPSETTPPTEPTVPTGAMSSNIFGGLTLIF